jgi:hypothetical protein
MAEYDFTLILTDDIRDFTDETVDALCEAGCDDATIAQRYGRIYVTFSRDAESLASAIVSAIEDVRKASICAGVMRVDNCNLVTQAEIARRLDRPRQAVGQYISGERGPGSFPPPACNIVEGQPLWYWCEVSHWLSRHNMISATVNQEAQEVSVINTILELGHLKGIAPELTQRLLKEFCICGQPPTVCSAIQDA